MRKLQKLLTVLLVIGCIANYLLVVGSLESSTKLETAVFSSSFTGQSLSVQLKWNYSGGLGRGSSVIFDIDGDGAKEVIIGGRYGQVICLSTSGSLEWSFDIGDHIYSTVTVVDLERDGKFEILIGSEYLANNVKTFFCLDYRGSVKWTFEPFEGKIYVTPTVIDLDKDGEFEILFGTAGGGFLYCLEPNGEKSWHYDCGTGLSSSTAVADLDGDGLPEIITANNGKIICLTHYGSLKWEYETDNIFGSSSTIGDLEGDGKLEVILGGGDKMYGGPNNYLYCLDENGTLNWRYKAHARIKSESVLFDLNQDGQQEIIFGAEDGAVYLLDSSGNESWSYQTDLCIGSSATIADLDADGSFEIVIGSARELFCFSYSGEKLWSYGLSDTERVSSSAGLGDLDDNDKLDIFCNCHTGKSYCLEVTGVSQSGTAPWYTFRGSMFHTGWADTDGDLLDDFTEEWYFQTDPENPDTDGDGSSDGEEYTYNTDPFDPLDPPEPTTSEPPTTSPTPPTTTSHPSTGSTPSTNDSFPFTGSLVYPLVFSLIGGYSTILLVLVVIRRRRKE